MKRGLRACEKAKSRRCRTSVVNRLLEYVRGYEASSILFSRQTQFTDTLQRKLVTLFFEENWRKANYLHYAFFGTHLAQQDPSTKFATAAKQRPPALFVYMPPDFLLEPDALDALV